MRLPLCNCLIYLMKVAYRHYCRSSLVAVAVVVAVATAVVADNSNLYLIL